MTYHNTTKLLGDALRLATISARTQDEIVLALLRTTPNNKATASQLLHEGIEAGYFKSTVPLTSIRRSLTSLTKTGSVSKLDETRIGIYGRPEYYYSLPLHS